jgi:hypothetical protein
MAELAIRGFLQFATSYLCKSAFAALTYIKSRYRTRLANVEDDLRAALSSRSAVFKDAGTSLS